MAEWNCNNCKYGLSEDYTVCMECRRGSKYKEKPILWGDKIRSMSDEELAKFLHLLNECECCLIEMCNEETCYNGCEKGILQWLKLEVKE